MIRVDSQNLIDKIQKLGKSIRPVQYGYPYIDLTKTVADGFESEDMHYRNITYASHLKN